MRLHGWVTVAALALVGCHRAPPPDDDAPRRKPASSAAEPVDPARVIAPASGRFRIVAPEGMTMKAEQVIDTSTAVGPLKLHFYQGLGVGEELGVTWADYPPGHAAKIGPKQVLLGVQNGALGGMGATLDTDQGGVRDGHPFRAFTFDVAATATEKAGFGREYVTLDGDRLYQVMFIGADRAAVESPRVRDWFDSFAIAK
ncbi:MAG: hypothetical protein NVS3B10_28670 [Polyangiales bacterium]